MGQAIVDAFLHRRWRFRIPETKGSETVRVLLQMPGQARRIPIPDLLTGLVHPGAILTYHWLPRLWNPIPPTESWNPVRHPHRNQQPVPREKHPVILETGGLPVQDKARNPPRDQQPVPREEHPVILETRG
jgi:hypothetical protein